MNNKEDVRIPMDVRDELIKNIRYVLRLYGRSENIIKKIQSRSDILTMGKDIIQDTLKGAVVDGMPHGTQTSNITLNAVIRSIDAQNETIHGLLRDIENIQFIIFEIGNIMDMLEFTPLERAIIEHKYFKQDAISDRDIIAKLRIEYKLKYSESHIRTVDLRNINRITTCLMNREALEEILNIIATFHIG